MLVVCSKYLSLNSTDHTQKCTDVPQTLTANFQGSYQGYWNTNSNFQLNSSLYVIEFSGASIDNTKYDEIMSSFQHNLNLVGEKAANRSTLWSLIVWSTFCYSASDSGVLFYSNTDAGVIFNLKSLVATLSSAQGICPNQMLSGSFDVSSKQLSIIIPTNSTALTDYFSDELSYYGAYNFLEPCPNQASLVKSGVLLPQYWMNYRNGYFDLSFDIRSAVLAVALSLNLTDASGLGKVTTQTSKQFHSYIYIDDSYSPPMDPVMCLDKADPFWKLSGEEVDGPEVCFVYQGVDQNILFAYPTMSGLNSYSSVCNCPEDKDDFHCNNEDYAIGFIYDLNFNFTNLVRSVALSMQDIVIKDPVSGDLTVINTLAPILVWTLKLQYYDESKYNYYHNSETIKESLSHAYNTICPSCGAAVLELYGYDFYGDDIPFYNKMLFAMNLNGVQLSQLSNATSSMSIKVSCHPPGSNNCTYKSESLPRFMCTDSFSQPSPLGRLAGKSPVPLVQNYYECQLRKEKAFEQAVGIAAGSASLYTSIFMAIFGFFLFSI